MIVREADISKGSLFYYFESKKNFYLYLYEYSGSLMESAVDQTGPDGQPAYLQYTDFFERIMVIQQLKGEATKKYPYLYPYIKKMIFDHDPAINKEINLINQRYTTNRMMDFFQNIDTHKFKDGIDPNMVLQLVSWSLEGCSNLMQLSNNTPSPSKGTQFDLKDAADLFNSYIKLFRDNFYKKEYL